MNHPEEKVVEPYDFRRPTTLAREHSRVLENAFETFARQWGTQLTANIRSRSQVTFDFVAMNSYDEYASSLPGSTTMVLVDLGDDAAKGVIQFPATAAFGWFSHMLGGTGKHKEVERPFTPIESSMLKKLLDDLIEDVKYSLSQLIDYDVTVESVSHNSQFAQAAAPTELMVVSTFTAQTGEQSNIATIAIPSEILLRKLGTTNPVVKDEDTRTQMASQLADVPIEVSLQIPPVDTTGYDVLNLTVGQIIPLRHPASRPLDLAVDGHPLARAAFGKSGTRLACTITDIKENHR
ncbi:flagellar motor switch protein FliM [Leifsonia sp. Leaf264]|uniref:flagellar motor switch protein FliM n=1 Tax=Leifsonia sp. Leaf264 TaxID=1736314 RepID=UPI001F2234E9|nr:flagellar motor switch protein FliM [Leifsonia sp. Leaf264]